MSNGLDNRSHLLSMAISPAYGSDGTLFLGTVADGMFKSENRGESWYRTSDSSGPGGTSLIMLSPDFEADQLVLAAEVGGGLFRSVDGGETWLRVSGIEKEITALGSYQAADGLHLLAADSDAGFLSSSDHGLTWRKSRETSKSAGKVIDCASSDLPVCYIGTDAHGVIQTTDDGVTLEPRNSGLPVNSEGQFEAITDLVVSEDFASDSAIFATTWNNAVYISRDRGGSWRKFDSGVTSDPQAEWMSRPHFSKLRVSKGPDRVTAFLAGFDGLFRSDDSGSSWSELETLSTGRVEALAMSPNYASDKTVAVVTQDGGAYVSKDAGLSWAALNRGLKHTHLWDIAFPPRFESDGMMLTISNQGFYWLTKNGVVWESTNLDRNKWMVRFGKLTGLDWRKIRYPLQIVIPRSFPRNEDVFVGTRYEGIYRSDDAGASWSQLDDAPVGWVNSMAISPAYESDGTVYAAYIKGQGTSAIYRTRNRGENWQRIASELGGVLSKHNDAEIKIAISPRYDKDQTIFIGTADGLFRSTDAGESWRKVTQSSVVESGYIRSIAISPRFGDDQTVFIGVKGKGLFKSIDNGISFFRVPVNEDLNGFLFEYLSISPEFQEDATIFASAHGEVLKSTDGGENWLILPRVVRYEDSNSVLSFGGEWETREGKLLSASKARFATSRGSRATLNFVGRGLTWIGPKSRDHGLARIYIDGSLKSTVSDSTTLSYPITRHCD